MEIDYCMQCESSMLVVISVLYTFPCICNFQFQNCVFFLFFFFLYSAAKAALQHFTSQMFQQVAVMCTDRQLGKGQVGQGQVPL